MRPVCRVSRLYRHSGGPFPRSGAEKGGDLVRLERGVKLFFPTHRHTKINTRAGKCG